MHRAAALMATVSVTAVALSACSSTSSSTITGSAPMPASTATAPASTAEPTAVPSATAPAATAVAATLAGCPAPRTLSSLPVLARPPISPDDLLAVPDGGLWISDPVGGAVVHVDAAGRLLQRIDVGEAPEGMVALSDGRIVLAEQTPNRLVAFTPPATSATGVVTLPSRGGAEGVDGIGIDTVRGRILIPDSPHGTLLAVPEQGGTAQQLAAGLGRDVGVTVGPDGALYVAVEGTRGLWRVPASGGATEPVGTLSELDDVVSAGGLLYATSLSADDVVAVDPRTGNDAVLVTGISAGNAQGLAVLADGRLAVADSGAGVVAAFSRCG